MLSHYFSSWHQAWPELGHWLQLQIYGRFLNEHFCFSRQFCFCHYIHVCICVCLWSVCIYHICVCVCFTTVSLLDIDTVCNHLQSLLWNLLSIHWHIEKMFQAGKHEYNYLLYFFYDLNILVIIWKQVFKSVSVASATNTNSLKEKKSCTECIIYL